MLQVRQGVFETNSSSTHSLNIVTEENFDYWKNNKDVYYVGDACGGFSSDKFGKEFVTKDEILAMAAKLNEKLDPEDNKYPINDTFFNDDENDDWYGDSVAREEGIISYEDWYEQEYLETYSHHFTTPSGDKMVAFGDYGTNY